MSADDARLDEVAAELYRQPPATFTAQRNARAEEAGGDLGRRIARLRKHTVAAWAVNLLLHDGQLGEALELSAALREAQEDLDAAELTRLGKQRRQVVAALARRAGDLAASAGTSLSPAMSDAVEKTVNAAVVDAAAAAVVRTGRLVSPIDLAALDGDALAFAVGGSLPEAAPAAAPRDDLAARRARKAAERAVREAERARLEAERAAGAAEKRLVTARERADRAHERVEGLRAELARAETEAGEADRAVEEREREKQDAVAATRSAQRAVERAEAARTEGTPE